MALKQTHLVFPLLLVCLSLLPALAPAQGPAPAPLDCSSALIPLLPCLDFVQGNVSVPPKNCCDALASVVASTPICLCALFSSSLGITVNITDALELPSLCKVTTPPISQCAANGYPVPGPLASPPTTKSPSTPPVSSPSSTVPSASPKSPTSSPPKTTPVSSPTTSPASTPAASTTPVPSSSTVPSTSPTSSVPASGPSTSSSKAPSSSTSSPPAPTPAGSRNGAAGLTVCGTMWLATMLVTLQMFRG